jgi:AraC-like DNA-binding protein
MRTESFSPSPALEPFVKTILIQESDGQEQKCILPITSVVLSFRIRGTQAFVNESYSRRLPLSSISGLRRTAQHIEYEKGTLVLIVFFREGAASSLLTTPIHELFGRSPSLNEVIAADQVAFIEDRLSAARENAERVALVEQFLLGSLDRDRRDPLIDESIRLINAHRGALRIRELLDRLPISLDAFEKRFRRAVGTTPKHYSSIVRMRTVIDCHAPHVTLTDAAYAAGFSDQSHFTREFEKFTGQIPRDYFRGDSHRQFTDFLQLSESPR